MMPVAKSLTTSQPLLMTSKDRELRSPYKVIQIISKKTIHDTHLSSGIFNLFCFRSQVYLDWFLHSKWLVPPDSKSHRIQTGQCERNELQFRECQFLLATRNALNKKPRRLQHCNELE